MNAADHKALSELCPPGDYTTDLATRAKFSKDYYWYSPRLTPILDDRVAEAVAHVRSTDTLETIIRYAAEHGIPLTPRGAGTGNYGQANPIEQGIVLDLRPLTQTFDLNAETGRLRISAGVRCQTIEERVRLEGWELPMYPSTWVKSTIGGFLAGGSAGIGSILNGVLRDGKMVTALTLLDSSNPPQLTRVEEAECLNYLHAYGINGFIVEAELQLVPKLPWEQIAFSSPDPLKLFAFGHALAAQDALRLRLLNFQQWPIPSFFTPIKKYYPDGESVLQLEVTSADMEALLQLASKHGLSPRIHFPHKEPRRAPMLSDFVQNHSTLWAKKADPDYTYLAAKIEFDHWESKVAALMERRNPTFALRADFNRTAGKPAIAAGPIFRAPDIETLQAAEKALLDLGIYFYDVHSPFLDRRGMETMHANKIALKPLRDPANILNPGKLSAEAPDLAATIARSW